MKICNIREFEGIHYSSLILFLKEPLASFKGNLWAAFEMMVFVNISSLVWAGFSRVQNFHPSWWNSFQKKTSNSKYVDTDGDRYHPKMWNKFRLFVFKIYKVKLVKLIWNVLLVERKVFMIKFAISNSSIFNIRGFKRW